MYEAEKSFRSPLSNASGMNAPEKPTPLAERLATAIVSFGDCISLANQIDAKIHGPTPSAEAKEAKIESISEMSLELNNRASRLHDLLERINVSLA